MEKEREKDGGRKREIKGVSQRLDSKLVSWESMELKKTEIKTSFPSSKGNPVHKCYTKENERVVWDGDEDLEF